MTSGASGRTPQRRGQVIRREYSRRGVLHRGRLLMIFVVAVLALAVVTGHLGHLLAALIVLALALVLLGAVVLARRVYRLVTYARGRWGASVPRRAHRR